MTLITPTASAGPYDNAAAQTYLHELGLGLFETPDELRAQLELRDPDLAGSQRQYALATLIAELVDPQQLVLAPGSIHGFLISHRRTGDLTDLAGPARDAVNRLLNDPWAALWQGWEDGGIAIKREVRVLRARLHRACTG